jgi:hypothetical protein
MSRWSVGGLPAELAAGVLMVIVGCRWLARSKAEVAEK